MSASVGLIPNLGAEEPGDWTRHLDKPGVRTSLELWRCLFAANHTLLGVADEFAEPFWPPGLGPVPTTAAFDWLDVGSATLAWLCDGAARDLAAGSGQPLVGADPEVVRRVHDKAFATRFADAEAFTPSALSGLDRSFEPKALFDADAFLGELVDLLARWPAWTGGRFTLKPRLGTSGRGRVGGRADALDAAAIAAALPRFRSCGGLIVEPWLDRDADFATLLYAPPEAADPLLLLGSLEQCVTPSGLCVGHIGEVDSRGRVFSGSRHDEALREASVALATAARDAGYTGPCGVDAFSFLVPDTPEPRRVLRPIVEFNARFTLGVVAIGAIRRAMALHPAPLGLAPGARRGVLVGLAPPPGLERWPAVVAPNGENVELVSLAADAGDRGPAVVFAPDTDTLRSLLGA